MPDLILHDRRRHRSKHSLDVYCAQVLSPHRQVPPFHHQLSSHKNGRQGLYAMMRSSPNFESSSNLGVFPLFPHSVCKAANPSPASSRPGSSVLIDFHAQNIFVILSSPPFLRNSVIRVTSGLSLVPSSAEDKHNLQLSMHLLDISTSPLGVLALAIACTTAAGILFKRARSKTPRKSLPSPPQLLPTWLGTLGGHRLQIKKGQLQPKMEAWADEFGGTYELSLFGTRRIVIVDPAESRRILTQRPGTFGRGPGPNNVDSAGRAVGMCPALFTDEDKAWGRSRRLVAPPFSGHNVRTMVPAVVKIATRLCAKWSAAAEGNGIVDAKDDLGHVAHDVIALVAFRHEAKALSATEDDHSVVFDALENMFDNFVAIISSPFLQFAYKYLPFNGWVRRVEREKAAVRALVKELCENERHLIALEKSPNDDVPLHTNAKAEASEGMLLRKLVEASDVGADGGRVPMPDDEVVTQARSLFLAGQETTSKTLAWCMYFLSKHPKVLARCREEAVQHISSSDGMVKNFEETTSLTYLTAVMKETLRIKSVVSVLTFWAKSEYTTLDGSTYPRGTSFAILLRYMSTREAYFTRAKEFIPERWMEAERDEALLGKGNPEGGGGEPCVVNHTEEAYFPFGFGPRICPGMGMANMEGLILLAALCVQFNFDLAPDQEDPPKDHHSVTSGPRNLKLFLTKRDKAA